MNISSHILFPRNSFPSRRWLHAFVIAAAGLLCACSDSGKPGASSPAGYHVRDGKVWFLPNWTSAAFTVEGADATSFVAPLPKGSAVTYAKDKASVYWQGKKLKGADPATFEVLDDRFSRDAANVYLGMNLVCDDSRHFIQVSPMFVKNSHAVFRLELLDLPPVDRIVSDDVAKFRQIAPEAPGLFHADSKQIFAGNTRMAGVDPAKFQHLGSNYWTDGGKVYYWDQPVPEVDRPELLEVLTGGYARDKARVFYLGKPLAGADPGTFEITDPVWPRAKDAKHAWDQDKMADR